MKEKLLSSTSHERNKNRIMFNSLRFDSGRDVKYGHQFSICFPIVIRLDYKLDKNWVLSLKLIREQLFIKTRGSLSSISLDV